MGKPLRAAPKLKPPALPGDIYLLDRGVIASIDDFAKKSDENSPCRKNPGSLTVAIALGQLLMSFTVMSSPCPSATPAARIAAAGASRSTLQPRWLARSASESDKNAEKSCASDILQQGVEIQSGAAPEIQRVGLHEDLCGPSPLIV